MKWRCNNICYHGRVTGQGEEIILFLHGFTGSHRSWNPFLPMLEQQYRLITIDLIGHGQSDAPEDIKRYDINQTAADLIEIMNQLPIEKIHVVGYSMGGRVAITLASLYPDRIASLFLESSTAGLRTEHEREERRKNDDLLAHKIERDGLIEFIDYWGQIPLFASQQNLPYEIKQLLRIERLSHRPIGLANSLRGMGTGSMPSWWDHLNKFTMPVHLVSGELDHKFCQIAKQMTDENKLFKHTIIRKAGHAIHLEKPREFASILYHFFLNDDSNVLT